MANQDILTRQTRLYVLSSVSKMKNGFQQVRTKMIFKFIFRMTTINLVMLPVSIFAGIIHAEKYSYTFEPVRSLAREMFVITETVPDAGSFKTASVSRTHSPASVSETFMVYFDKGSSIIDAAGFESLKTIHSKIGSGSIAVFGYTSSSGSNELNQKLAWDRAENVSGFFKNRGITVRRVEGKPMCCYLSDSDEWKNRRVEIVLSYDNSEDTKKLINE